MQLSCRSVKASLDLWALTRLPMYVTVVRMFMANNIFVVSVSFFTVRVSNVSNQLISASGRCFSTKLEGQLECLWRSFSGDFCASQLKLRSLGCQSKPYFNILNVDSINYTNTVLLSFWQNASMGTLIANAAMFN